MSLQSEVVGSRIKIPSTAAILSSTKSLLGKGQGGFDKQHQLTEVMVETEDWLSQVLNLLKAT